MNKQFTARSPGKLILTGEHAVVYGQPAIAMAINRYAESTISPHFSPAILFNFLNLRYAKSFTLNTLSLFKDHLQKQYHAFLEGHCNIREVLKKPFELLQFTVTHLLETWRVPLSQGFEIRSASTIPMGCGMGSSAAAVMSTAFALAEFFGLKIDHKRFLSLGKEAENLQHGRSSGLDLHLAMTGGCLKFEAGNITAREMPKFPMQIVQTGVPESTTGECVANVAKHFTGSNFISEFGAVTEAFDLALLNKDFDGLKHCVRENHQLLVKIGVVPSNVQSFVRDIEKLGSAAKICGAGTVRGQKSGVILVLGEVEISSLVKRYGYTLEALQGDFRGTHLV